MPPMPDPSEIQHHFDTNGFYIAKSLIPEAMIANIFSQIEDLLDEALRLHHIDPKEFAGVDEKYSCLKNHHPQIKSHVYDLIKSLSSVHAVANFPPLLKIIENLTGSSLLLDGTQLRINDSDNDGLIPFHQEINNTYSNQCITTWIPLVDLTKVENGALRFVPQSHKQGYIKHSQVNGYPAMDETCIDPSKIEHACLSRGDALIFHRHLFHASGANNSSQTRWTFITRYSPLQEIPYLENGQAPLRVPYPEFQEQH